MCPPDRSPPQAPLPSWDKCMVAELRCPAALESAFRLLDRNGDGEVSSMDLLDFFSESMRQKLSPAEGRAMIAAADRDGKGSANLSEFCHLLRSVQCGEAASEEGFRVHPHAMAVLWDAFCVLDADKDGLISPLDLKIALPSSMFSDACIDDMLAAVHQGKLLEFQSFVHLITNP